MVTHRVDFHSIPLDLIKHQLLTLDQLGEGTRRTNDMDGASRVFAFKGPVVDSACKTKPEAPLSPANALEIVRAAFFAGRLHITTHFKEQQSNRHFDSMDAENAIRTGELRGEPEFCPENGNWKYRIIANVEDQRLEIVVALDPTEDYGASPLIILITGYWR